MADYHEISQEYAKGAIRAAILVNSGGAVALLSQLSSLDGIVPLDSVAWAILLYVFGIGFGILGWFAGFLSARHTDRTLRQEASDFATSNRFQLLGLLFVLLSTSFFIFAAWLVASKLI